MYKVSDFDFLKNEIDFSYKKDFSFYAVAASEDDYKEKMLFYLLDIKYLSFLEKHKDNIAGIICTKDIDKLINKTYKTIVTSEPKTLFFLIHNNLNDYEKVPTIIEEGCIISDKAYISPYNVVIKSGTVIEEFVSVKENVEIGQNCHIFAGCVIGSEGFNIFQLNGNNCLVKHRGRVIIGNNVNIMCNSCVDKGIYAHQYTKIEDNTFIDNLVQIAHDTKIKKNSEICAGVVTCGYVEVGENVFMGVNSAVKQLLKVGNNSKIGMGAFVNKSVDNNTTMVGTLSYPIEKAKILKSVDMMNIEKIQK